MGKRSSFERIPQDFYPTPRAAVEPLLPHLEKGTRFIEPCAGAGHLIRHLQYFGHVCVGAYDVEPRHPSVKIGDARRMRGKDVPLWVTNCPWRRDMFHPILENLAKQAPIWTVIDCGWLFTKQAREYMPMLRKIVTIGRVCWVEGTDQTGKDDCCWILADATRPATPIEFVGSIG